MGYKIAIDGPSASGKTEVSKMLAKKLKITAVDSGAIYRAVALYCVNNNIDVKDSKLVINNLDNVSIKLTDEVVYLNGKDVSKDIRKNEISIVTSIVATIDKVREFVTKVQRQVAGEKNVVMQGRDITSVVLPDADIKIYLNAAPEIRALRRQRELNMKGEQVALDEVLDSIKKRDEADMTRNISPLVKTKDSIEIDTTNLGIDDVVNKIINIAKERGVI